MYPLIRDLLFHIDAEKVHKLTMDGLDMATKSKMGWSLANKLYSPESVGLSTKIGSLCFPNPVGLAAGFDKNGEHLTSLSALGFGFIEVGTITPKPQPGNDKPRLFRLPEDKALINRMGFNNNGADSLAKNLYKFRANGIYGKTTPIIGVNIGKNKSTDNSKAWEDYCISFEKTRSLGDYFVVNVSSPNTTGLRELQQKDFLLKIFHELQNLNHSLGLLKPIFLKISPDISFQQLDDILSIIEETNMFGIIATNTTISRTGLKSRSTLVTSLGEGGLSGKPLFEKSTSFVSYIRQNSSPTFPIIASGGIFSGEDALGMVKKGANLLQVWTGFVYRGPSIVKDICDVLRSH